MLGTSRQTQCPQPVHVLDNSRVPSLLLLQRLIDLGGSLLTAIKNRFGDFLDLGVRHNAFTAR
jgi:hypothetical protein